MIISRTPFRVSFFGGGTDFPEFYGEHGGAVLATTIDKYCYISLHRLGQFFEHRFRASYARTELVNDPAEFEHPLIRECLGLLDIKERLEITHVSDIPGRTGLGTSSSFTVGLLNALHTFTGTNVPPEDLAREAIIVERDRVGDAGGHQDQYAAACGGPMRIEFRRDGTVEVKQLAVETSRMRALSDRMVLYYTGIQRSAQGTLREQKNRTQSNTNRLMEMLAMVDTAQSILCADGNLDAFGDLLHDSWQRKRELAPGISNAAVDTAYDAARKAGARGGKLLGAGGRGFLLLYIDPKKQVSVAKALEGMTPVRFSFTTDGSSIIFDNADSEK